MVLSNSNRRKHGFELLLITALICNISFLQYQESFPVYKATAQHWSHVYAGSEHRVFDYLTSNLTKLFLDFTFQHPEYEGMLRQLQDMGIDEVNWKVVYTSSCYLICRVRRGWRCRPAVGTFRKRLKLFSTKCDQWTNVTSLIFWADMASFIM